jgi:hypothetical protein
MLRNLILISLSLMLLAATASGAEVIRVGRWELHSSFWMNLHQTLMHDAVSRESRDLTGLSPKERESWSAAVAAYRAAARLPQIELQDALTQVADDAVKIEIAGPLGDALRKAAPVYRAHWWPSHDQANRFLLGYATALLRDAGEELVQGHEKAYGQPFPATTRVDLAAYAGRFGANSIYSDYGVPVATIASLDEGNQGLRILETVVHESSHAIVSPSSGRVSSAIAAAAAKHGVQPPRDLWHAILFATSSELTRRALALRGVTVYETFASDLFTREWPHYRSAIETHWHAYLSGNGTLEEAIEKIVAAVR